MTAINHTQLPTSHRIIGRAHSPNVQPMHCHMAILPREALNGSDDVNREEMREKGSTYGSEVSIEMISGAWKRDMRVRALITALMQKIM